MHDTITIYIVRKGLCVGEGWEGGKGSTDQYTASSKEANSLMHALYNSPNRYPYPVHVRLSVAALHSVVVPQTSLDP